MRVNVVAPGFFPTLRIEELAREQDTNTSALVDQIIGTPIIPLQRVGTAAELAQLVTFLVSPAASYLTGSRFVADGGAFPTV